MQTRMQSVIEVVTTTAVGYLVSVAAGQLWLYPLFEVEVSLNQNFGLTAGFVGISLCIKYVLRRFFTRKWRRQ